MSSNEHSQTLNPALKQWLDQVLIPALVREYMTKLEKRGKVEVTDSQEVSR